MTKIKIKTYAVFFIIGWLFIGFVSSVDAGLTIKLQSTLKDHEQNPLARMILAEDGWHTARFIAMKMFGTILVLGILMMLKNTKYGFPVIAAIVFLQATLLLYLLL